MAQNWETRLWAPQPPTVPCGPLGAGADAVDIVARNGLPTGPANNAPGPRAVSANRNASDHLSVFSLPCGTSFRSDSGLWIQLAEPGSPVTPWLWGGKGALYFPKSPKAGGGASLNYRRGVRCWVAKIINASET